MKDYYKILGVSKDAPASEIKKAYHKLAHKHHPDKGGDEKEFKEINEAYQVLSDQEKRLQYDKFGRVFDQPGPQGAPGFGGFRAGFGQEMPFENLEDVLEQVFGFSSRGKPKDLKRGSDIQVDINISLEDILKTHERKIVINTKILCTRCNGSGAEKGSDFDQCSLCKGEGQVQQIRRTFLGTITRHVLCPECKGEGSKPKIPCNVCKGEGRVGGEKEISCKIPAGVDSNQILEFQGFGEAGKRGGDAGNLYLRLFIKPHSLFERKGDDLFTEVPISFSQAVLGDNVDVLTVEGKKISLKVPSGTRSGKTLRISQKGIPHFAGYGKGNFYVKLIIKTPKKPTKRQKELLKKLKQEGL